MEQTRGVRITFEITEQELNTLLPGYTVTDPDEQAGWKPYLRELLSGDTAAWQEFLADDLRWFVEHCEIALTLEVSQLSKKEAA